MLTLVEVLLGCEVCEDVLELDTDICALVISDEELSDVVEVDV